MFTHLVRSVFFGGFLLTGFITIYLEIRILGANADHFIPLLCLNTLLLLLGVALFFIPALKNTETNEETLTQGNESDHQQSVDDLAGEESENEFDIEMRRFAGDVLAKNGDAEEVLRAVCNKLDACLGLVYMAGKDRRFLLKARYALIGDIQQEIISGEGLTGQVLKNAEPVFLKELPKGYMKVVSGLGESSPTHLLIFPALTDGKVQAVIELAFFQEFSSAKIEAITSCCEKLFVDLSNKQSS